MFHSNAPAAEIDELMQVEKEPSAQRKDLQHVTYKAITFKQAQEAARRAFKQKEEAAERMAALLLEEEAAKDQAEKSKKKKKKKKRIMWVPLLP